MARTFAEQADLEHIDVMLREMFLALSAQPLPSRLLSVVDQLDESDAEPVRMRRRGA